MPKVLDKGFINLIDKMGCDAAIASAARVSYNKQDEILAEYNIAKDTKLIRYLMRHNHTSPFEMAELKFHVKLPIFVARQWMRHRTGSFNEISARYTQLSSDYYVPDIKRCQFQSHDNKQGSSQDYVDPNIQHLWQDMIYQAMNTANQDYRELVRSDIAKELARIVLPLSQYTEFYWKVDLHNLFHFMLLRSDNHAQFEIREYSKALEKIVKEHFPISYQAWVDYKRDAVTFSKQEMEHLLRTHSYCYLDQPDTLSNREWKEFKQKLGS
jgi:thymidylate synthase (FAD)